MTLSTILGGAFFAFSVAMFWAGAAAAEGALHPVRLAVPPGCPATENVDCTTAEITAAGVALRGWFFRPHTFNGGVVIVLHGIGASREQAAGLGRLFLPSGYAVLAPDLRGHGESGGTATYGVLEARDVHLWADWLFTNQRVSRLYGMGESLGASVLLQSLQVESRFRAVIAESAYSDFPSVARERVRRLLPSDLGWLAVPVVSSGLAWTRLKYGLDLRQASSIDAARKTHVPVLLIHGLADNLTSPENSRRIAAANPSIQLWLIPGAGHTAGWATAQKEFEVRVPTWVASH